MALRIILWASIIWLLPYLYYVLKNEVKFKKNIVLGVTLPQEARQDPDVLTLLTGYLKELKTNNLILWLAVIPCVLPSDYKLLICLYCVWIDALLVLLYLPFIRYNKKLSVLKEKKGWKKSAADGSSNIVTVRLSEIAVPRQIPTAFFVLCVAICLVPIFFHLELTPISVIFALCAVLMLFFHRFYSSNRSDKANEDVELTFALTQARLLYRSKAYAVSTLLLSLMSLSGLLMFSSALLYFILIIVLTTILLSYLFSVEMKMRNVQERLTASIGSDEYVDDDDHWIWGFIYYNKNDSHSLVNTRIGIGETMNLAKTSGKVWTIFGVGCLILMPFLSYMIDGIVPGKITLTVTGTSFSAEATGKPIVVRFDDIVDYEVLDDYPQGYMRVFGTATDKIHTGSYSTKKYGSVKVMLNPGNTPYLFIKDKRNNQYLFSLGDTPEGVEILKRMQQLIPAAVP